MILVNRHADRLAVHDGGAGVDEVPDPLRLRRIQEQQVPAQVLLQKDLRIIREGPREMDDHLAPRDRLRHRYRVFNGAWD